MAPPIHGFVRPGFEAVRDAFAQNFDEGLEDGASICVVGRKGETLLDIYAGQGVDGTPWRKDTIVNVFSTAKGITALCCAICADRGLLDYNEKVTKYWPEFGQKGKGNVTVAELLSHQAGVNGIRRPDAGPDGAKFLPEDIYNWDKVTAQLAQQKPYWDPGTMNGYHVLTFGFLAGELVRRVTGQGLGQFFRENVAEPLGVDFHIGLPESEDYRVLPIRIAPVAGAAVSADAGNAAKNSSLSEEKRELLEAQRTAFSNPNVLAEQDGVATCNTKSWRRAEVPAANGHSNAAAVARIYCCLANGGELDGVRIISPGGIRAATKMALFRKDLIMGFKIRMSMGFLLNDPLIGLQGPNEGSFGHAGAGGSCGFADPLHGLGFGYAMNKMSDALNGDPRVLRLIEALYGCLGQPIRYQRDENTGLPRQSVRLESANNGNLGGGRPIPARL